MLFILQISSQKHFFNNITYQHDYLEYVFNALFYYSDGRFGIVVKFHWKEGLLLKAKFSKHTFAMASLTALSIFGASVQTVLAAPVTSHANSQITSSRNGTQTIHLKSKDGRMIDATIKRAGNTITVTTTIDGQFQGKTVVNKQTGKIVHTSKSGNVQTSTLSDFLSPSTHGPASMHATKSQSPAVIVGPGGGVEGGNGTYNQYVTDAYDSGIGETGWLWQHVENPTYGSYYTLKYVSGTAIGIILGALATIFTGGIAGIIAGLGASIVGDAISTEINGVVQAKYIKHDYAVWSQGKIGLKTNKTYVYALTDNYNTMTISSSYLTTQGDSRSNTALCDAGAYNVWLQNQS